MSRMLAAWRHAPTHQKVWALAAPMILSNLSVPLVALVDSSVIGHLPHAHQLGAVAVGGSLYTLLVWVMGFLRMGSVNRTAALRRRDGAAAGKLGQHGQHGKAFLHFRLVDLIVVIEIGIFKNNARAIIGQGHGAFGLNTVDIAHQAAQVLRHNAGGFRAGSVFDGLVDGEFFPILRPVAHAARWRALQ